MLLYPIFIIFGTKILFGKLATTGVQWFSDSFN